MDDSYFLIPRRLDDPPQFFLWDADEAVLAMFFAILGALVGLIIPGVLVGLLLARAFGTAPRSPRRCGAATPG